MIKRNIIIIILALLSLYACKSKTKTITLTNIAIDIPEDFTEGFLNQIVESDNNLEYYNSYGVQRKTAIYSIVYKKYKPAYNGIISLENVKNQVINGLKNHPAIKEFKVEDEGIIEGNNNCYQVLSTFYYGPNKTNHKAFLMIHENSILQIICMYNSNSKKDDREINNIIKSVRIVENNTNN